MESNKKKSSKIILKVASSSIISVILVVCATFLLIQSYDNSKGFTAKERAHSKSLSDLEAIKAGVGLMSAGNYNSSATLFSKFRDTLLAINKQLNYKEIPNVLQLALNIEEQINKASEIAQTQEKTARYMANNFKVISVKSKVEAFSKMAGKILNKIKNNKLNGFTSIEKKYISSFNMLEEAIKLSLTKNNILVIKGFKNLEILDERKHASLLHLNNELSLLTEGINSITSELREKINALAISIRDLDSNRQSQIYIYLFLTCVLLVLIQLVTAYFVAKPLRSIALKMKDFNQGDFTSDIKEAERTDEFGDIAKMLSEFRKNAIKVEAMQNALQDKISTTTKEMKVKNQFMSKMGHEIRTPLDTIIGYSELVADSMNENVDLHKIRTDVKKIASVGQNLLSMVDSVLEMTEDTEQDKVRVEDFKVRDEVQRILPTVGDIVLNNSNKFRVNCPDSGIRMNSDPGKVMKIIATLTRVLSQGSKNGQIILEIKEATLGDLAAVRFKLIGTSKLLTLEKVKKILEPSESTGELEDGNMGPDGVNIALAKQFSDKLYGKLSFGQNRKGEVGFIATLPADHTVADTRAKELFMNPLSEVV